MKKSAKVVRAILIDVISPETDREEAKKRLQELEMLVTTFGGIAVVKTIQKKDVPDYQTYVGKGKLREIIQTIEGQVEDEQVDVIVINNLLKPRQIYNINEKLRKADLKTKAWDRVDLILKIFSKHAQSTEAKLQIELASIRHMGPRIFDMGIELSRQAGAMGVRAGQGESNTEMMKRHLQKQELNIKSKLKHYKTIRAGHRRRRRRRNLPTVALVGYTNAGKSSLLNALTQKGAYVANKLFATLDTRVGKLYIPPKTDENTREYVHGKEILISDTIGFIQDLPPELIEAFKSTLAETVDADLLLHVIDATDPHVHKKIEVVEEILKQLDADQKPKLYVFNKMDLINHNQYALPEPVYEYHGLIKASPQASKDLGWHSEERYLSKMAHKSDAPISPKTLAKKYNEFSPVFVSAHQSENLHALVQKICTKV